MLSTTLACLRPALPRVASARPFASAAAPIRETGYNFTINDDEREIIDLAEKFTRDEIIPNAPHHDRTGEYPWDIVKKAHSLGLMNTHVPPEYGGMCALHTFDNISHLKNREIFCSWMFCHCLEEMDVFMGP